MIALLLLLFAPVPFPKPPPDLKILEGRWVRIQKNSPYYDFEVTITGNRMKYSQRNSSTTYEYVITLDPRKKLKVFDSLGVGGMAKGHTYKGIYMIRDERLYLYSKMGRERPSVFDESKPGVILEIFVRVRN